MCPSFKCIVCPKIDELLARDYKARADVISYLGQKQQLEERFQKKMRRHPKRLQKKATNDRGDKETQLINLRAAGEDSEELQNEIQEIRRKYPGYTSMYDSNKIPMLKK